MVLAGFITAIIIALIAKIIIEKFIVKGQGE